MSPPEFPITALLPDIRRSLQAHTRLVLEAPPGAGKTTQVPLALLDAPWLEGRRIVMLEPRRVAARSAAMFMARQLGEDVGDTVGYRIRFENRIGPRTRIEVVTEGILVRRIQRDPALEGTGMVVLDEVHERSVHTDLAMALTLDARSALCPDLRVLAMSATLDTGRLAAALGADPVLDDEALHAYRARLLQLDDLIDDTAVRGDRVGRQRLEREREALLAQLRTAAGLGGRIRRLGDETERARKTVTARIRDTLRKLDTEHPGLAAHLRASVSTGTTCAYRPPTPVHWDLRTGA
jgi:Rad3-related DNA helicase